MQAKLSIVPRALAIFLTAALAHCATGYGEAGVTGGYTDKIIEPDIAVVVVKGNAYAPAGKMQEIAMLRAAELTLQQGYRRFSLFTIEDQAAADALRAGRLGTYLREKAAREKGGPQLNTEIISSLATGATWYQKFGGGLFVVMHKDRPGGYHARAVVAVLRPRLAPAASAEPAPAVGDAPR
jgi:hypothetical protein